MSGAATVFALVGGVALGAALAGNSYAQPVYQAPPPVYQPVYYQPQPVVYRQEVYTGYRPARYDPPRRWDRYDNRWDQNRWNDGHGGWH